MLVKEIAKHTNLVQFNLEVFGVLLVEQRLGRAAVGAVRLAEDDDVVLVNNRLGFGLRGRHGGGSGRGEAAREKVLDWIK